MSNQAAWLNAAGAKLEVGPAEEAVAGPDEVVVRTRAVAINPADGKIQETGAFISSWPTLLGYDVAGDIIALGPDVGDFQIGDRVIGQAVGLIKGHSKYQGFQLNTVLSTKRIAKLPTSLSFVEGAVLPVAIGTASSGLYGVLSLPEPDRQDNSGILVVYGASSSVGTATIQLAVASGTEVIGIASEKNFDLLREAGADHTFDYKDPEVANQVITAIKQSGRKFAGVFDTISLPESYRITLPIVEAFGGNMATVLPPPQSVPKGVKAESAFALSEHSLPIWSNFVGLALEQGKLKPLPKPYVVGKGLEAAQEGLEQINRGVSGRKLVIEL